MRHDPASRTRRRTNTLLALAALPLLLTLTLAVSAAPAAALNQLTGTDTGANGALLCATGSDYTSCLPSGRWGGLVGNLLQSRIEPYKTPVGYLTNLGSFIGATTRNILPNMLMMVTQTCWNSALGLSQFAARFTPLDKAGAAIDKASATLIDSILTGSIPAALATVAILALIGATVFKSAHQAKHQAKRILVTIVCLGALASTGAAAAHTGENAATPATGSPWWVVRTINSTINKLTFQLDLDDINDQNPDMMASNATGDTTCQHYLYQMHQQYEQSPEAGGETSNVTKAVNRLWEETALRGWVTMQFGNPAAGGNTNETSAQNAMQAYCHVLDMQADTPASEQAWLTNAAMNRAADPRSGQSGEVAINDSTAKWLFDENGWISTFHSFVDDGDDTDDRDPSIMQMRAAIFWETCTTDQNGRLKARDGWAQLINNLGDNPTYEIKNGGKKVRAGNNDTSGGKSLKRVRPDDDGTLMASGGDATASTLKICQAVLKSQPGGVFNRPNDGWGGKRDGGSGFNDTNLGDAATLGWRFDVPNTGGTWSEANLGSDLNDPATGTGAMKHTIDLLYGNTPADVQGAFGSCLGAIVNLIVWGALSIISITAKIALTMMGVFLAFALVATAFPIGRKPVKAIGNWAKFCANLSLTGLLYSAIGSIATFIVSLSIDFCSGMAGTFIYNIIAGCSPMFAIILMGMFCQQVLKMGNPFTLQSLRNIAGGTMLAGGMGGGMRMLTQAPRRLAGTLNRRTHTPTVPARHATTGSNAGTQGPTNAGGLLGRIARAQAESEDRALRNTGRDTISAAAADATGHPIIQSLAGGMAKAAGHRDTARLHATGMGADDRTDAYRDRYIARTAKRNPAGPDLAKADRYAERRQKLHAGAFRAGEAIKAGGNYALAAGALAGGVLRSKPLRQSLGKAVRPVATAAAGAALMSNPITAPLGLAAYGRLLTSRSTYMLANDMAGMAAGAGATVWRHRHDIGDGVYKALGDWRTTAGRAAASVRANPAADRLRAMAQTLRDGAPAGLMPVDAPDGTPGGFDAAPTREAPRAEWNPVFRAGSDPETDVRYKDRTPTRAGVEAMVEVQQAKEERLRAAGLDDGEVQRRMRDYVDSGRMDDDAYQTLEARADLRHHNHDYERVVETGADGRSVERIDRMRRADGGGLTDNGRKAYDAVEQRWVDRFVEHGMSEQDARRRVAGFYGNERFQREARRYFNENFGYSGKGMRVKDGKTGTPTPPQTQPDRTQPSQTQPDRTPPPATPSEGGTQ